jgi:alkylation response protein AidB-like acyl-CoA dehydrogenase
MHVGLSDDQQAIRRAAQELLGARSPWSAVRAVAEGGGDDADLWSELVSLGWPGIAVAEEHGGEGLGAVELVLLLEEAGYACATAPLLATAVVAAAIQRAGDRAQREHWLPALASGEATGAIGRPELAVGAADAAVFVLLVDGRLRLVAREDADVRELRTVDPTRPAMAVQATGARMENDGTLGAFLVQVAVAAELAGVARRALDMTVSYAKERRQFGVAIGAHQSVAHRCAEMLLLAEGMRSTARYAALIADADPQRLRRPAAVAAATAADGGREVTAAAIQLHGGVGFTWEADVHWLYKRAQIDAALLGGGHRHRVAIATEAGGAVG